MRPRSVGLVYKAWTTPDLVRRWWSGYRGEVTTCLTEADGRTSLTILVQHTSKQHRDAHIDSGMEAGMQESMDRLEQVAARLAQAASGSRPSE
jgi:uncharacterized protein YndB with AHSA1/START domain